MTNEPPEDADPTASGRPSDGSGAPRASFRSALRGLRRAASEAADAGAEEARKLAEAARPEIERRAKQAKAAADAARPHIEEKAREATTYVREHQDEIVRASKRGAEVAASGAARAVTPGPLRPAIDAMERELRDQPPEDESENESEDAANPENATRTGPSPSPSERTPQPPAD